MSQRDNSLPDAPLDAVPPGPDDPATPTVVVVCGSDREGDDGSTWVQHVFADLIEATHWIDQMDRYCAGRLASIAQDAPTVLPRATLVERVVMELRHTHPDVFHHLSNRRPTLPHFVAVGPLPIQRSGAGPAPATPAPPPPAG